MNCGFGLGDDMDFRDYSIGGSEGGLVGEKWGSISLQPSFARSRRVIRPICETYVDNNYLI